MGVSDNIVYESWMYLQLEDCMMAQSTLWMTDLKVRSCTGSFFLSLSSFSVLLVLKAGLSMEGFAFRQKLQSSSSARCFGVPYPSSLGSLCQSSSFLLCVHYFLRETCTWARKRENFLLRWTQWWNKHKWLSRKTRDYKANSKLILWVLKCRNWDTKPGKC